MQNHRTETDDNSAYHIRLGLRDQVDPRTRAHVVTPAPQNGNGWRRLRSRGDIDKMAAAASLKYGKPEVHAGDAHNDVRADARVATLPDAQIGSNAATIDNTNNESLTYI